MKSVQRTVTEQQSARKRAQRQRGADVEASVATASPSRAATASPARASPSSRPSPARGSGATATRRGGALAQPRTPPAAAAPAPAPSSAAAPPAGFLGAGAIPLIEAHVEQLERTLGEHARTMRTMQTQLLELKNVLAVLRERAASSSLPPASPAP